MRLQFQKLNNFIYQQAWLNSRKDGVDIQLIWNKVEIDPRNPRYSVIDWKFIIGKSDIKNDGYDIFVFAVRDIIEALIPSYIKIIGLHAFNNCANLQKPWISTKFWTSNHLQRNFCKFNQDSQSHNPSSWVPFHYAQVLTRIEISQNSEFQSFGLCFNGSSINSIFVPSQLRGISFYECQQLQINWNRGKSTYSNNSHGLYRWLRVYNDPISKNSWINIHSWRLSTKWWIFFKT